MAKTDPARKGAIAYTRDRWGKRFLGAVLGPGVFLACSVLIWQLLSNDGQSAGEAAISNLAPIVIAGLLGLLLWIPAALIWGLKEQRDVAWGKLDLLERQDSVLPSFEIFPLTSEKVGRQRYAWLTTATVRHEMKLVVKNLGSTGRFFASAKWGSNETPWDVEWEGRHERITQIPSGATATLVLALVGLRGDRWFAYGVRPGKEIGPRVELKGDVGVAIQLTVHDEVVDAPAVAHLRLSRPSDELRPKITLA